MPRTGGHTRDSFAGLSTAPGGGEAGQVLLLVAMKRGSAGKAATAGCTLWCRGVGNSTRLAIQLMSQPLGSRVA